MSRQTHWVLKKDAAKKRREYLLKKFYACLLAGCFVICALTLLFWTASIVSSKYYDFQHPDSSPAWYSFDLFMRRYLERHLDGLAIPAGRVALLVVTALQCCVLFCRKAKQAASIPYALCATLA